MACRTFLDTEEVRGSNPRAPTGITADQRPVLGWEVDPKRSCEVAKSRGSFRGQASEGTSPGPGSASARPIPGNPEGCRGQAAASRNDDPLLLARHWAGLQPGHAGR